MSSLRKFLLLPLLLVMTDCGYTLSHRLKDVFADKRGIFVPVLDNATDEVGAERVFTNALIRELMSRNEVVVGSREQGSYQLTGSIARIEQITTASSELGLQGLQSYRRVPSEIGVRVTLFLALVDLSTGRPVWERQFVGFRRINAPLSRTYDFQAPSSVGPTTQSLVETLYSDIARDMMRDLYDEMIEFF